MAVGPLDLRLKTLVRSRPQGVYLFITSNRGELVELWFQSNLFNYELIKAYKMLLIPIAIILLYFNSISLVSYKSRIAGNMSLVHIVPCGANCLLTGYPRCQCSAWKQTRVKNRHYFLNKRSQLPALTSQIQFLW